MQPDRDSLEQVAYDAESLLLKLPGSMDGTVTDAMGAAGVAKLELLFELENAAWYEARLLSGTDAATAVEALRAIDGILMVDYNYQVRTADIGDYTEVPESLLGNSRVSEQWYLNTCGIFDGMDELTVPGGSPSVVVAVIDTGELFTGWEKPFYITVAPDCPNDYIFNLNVTMSCTNGMDPDDTAEYVTQGTVQLRVRSCKVLPSVISEDMTLTSDNLYIIPSGTVITKGTTAAQALIMQGEATADGISLTWMQDDFDTLIGYNVYRSDSEDGYYQRLNEQVIPADTKAFFDDTVEPGVVYYYNFTVVKTDLSESTPSGKITIQALDTMAPNIYHTPVYTARTGANLVITATVTHVSEGESCTHFGPNAICNRAQVVTFLYRTVGQPPVSSDSCPFTDVKSTDFFYKPVLWAVENGITAGLTATTFGPNAICNRAQVVTFLYRSFS